MEHSSLLIRQILVLASAIFYWGGVIIHTLRIRRHIGRSPNIQPRGLKEKLLWLGWFIVIAGWIGQPIILGNHRDMVFFTSISLPFNPVGIFLGMVLLLGGHLGTLWCYTALGDSWRIGINKRERTALVRHGPYRFVRHPIYLFQIILLIGMFFLLLTPFSFLLLVVDGICISIKILDEEAYLLSIHGSEYLDYFN